MMNRTITALAVLTAATAASAQVASLGAGGYAQNFDSMGTAGTSAPTGWRHFATSFGSNATWTTALPANGANSVATDPVTRPATTLTATSAPTANNNNGYNAAISAGNTADRVLATAPTTVAGAVLQLALSNDSGAALTSLQLGFSTVRFTAVTTANQLPGYRVFVSLDAGATWTNIGTNPTIATVPNTVGVTPFSESVTLPAAWSAGATAYFRFVDDNAQETSPDQIIGLNNVVITAVPAPGALALVGLGVLVGGRRRR